MVRMAVGFAAMLAPLQLLIGDQHGLNTLAAPAGEGRGDGGALGRQLSRATCVFRLAGREARKRTGMRSRFRMAPR